MKKLFWASIVLMVSMMACEKPAPEGGDEKDPEETVDPDKGDQGEEGEGEQGGGDNTGGDNTGGEDEGDEGMTSSEQKEKLESIANAIMAEFPYEDYDEMMSTLSGLYTYSMENFFSEDYDLSALESVFEERYDAMFSYEDLGNNTASSTYLLFLSECKGHVEMGPSAATYKDSDDTSVRITDDKGVVWDVAITTEGAVKKVFVGEFEESWVNSYYDEINGWYDEEYTEYYHIEVEVPEKLIMVLEKNGSHYADITLNFDVDLGSNGIDAENDKVSVTATVDFQNLELVVDKFGINANTGIAEYSAVLKNNGRMILTEKASGKGNIDYDAGTWSVKDINIDVDIMGLMQFKGTCPDVNSIYDLTETTDPQTESDWERYVNNLNKMFNVNMYYDGSSVSQAIINFEPRVYEDEWGKYFDAEPAIEFPDGSRFLFAEYFNESRFSDLVSDGTTFIEAYIEMFERYFGLSVSVPDDSESEFGVM